jgi:hypothetical protein
MAATEPEIEESIQHTKHSPLMKKVSLLVLVLFAGTMSLFAQNKPESGVHFVVGLEGGLNSLNFNQGDSAASAGGMVGFRYKLSDMGITARIGANLSMRNNETTGTSLGQENMTTVKQTNFSVSLGAHKNFTGTDNLETYLGADLSVGSVGGGETIVRSETVSTEFGGTVGDYTENTFTAPKGLSIGLTPLVGFQYFFVPKLAIGGEFGYGFFTTNMKSGKEVEVTSIGGVTTTTTVQADITNKVSGLGGRGTGRILFTVYF